jgi:arylsulfatase A-like enzyme
MTIVNGVGRIGWMSGGKAARWKDETMADTITGQALKFIEREKDHPFFLYFATHNIHVPRVPNPRFKGTSPSGTRGDSIQELDDAAGQLLAKLDELKLTDRTLLIFSSDNGGILDDGYEDVGRTDYSPNAPLRGTKGTLFEGGHRVPLIARWPGHIKPGTTSSKLLALLDLPATCAALVGATIPAGQCRDSVNVLSALLGQGPSARTDFVAHNGGTAGPFALRAGPWKFIGGAIRNGPNAARNPGQPQLFNLADDLAEEKNLVKEQPEKAAEMQALLAKIRGAAPAAP